jgi:hypothetical protein
MAERKDRIRVHIEGKEYSVVGGSFEAMLAAVKQINGRRFVGELKVWELPGTVEAVRNQLEIGGYQLEGGRPVAAAEQAADGPAGRGRARGDRIRVLVEGQAMAVVGGSFQEMLAAVKSLPGRRFDPDTKVWEIPGEAGVVKGMVQAAGFRLEGAGDIPLEQVPPMEGLEPGPRPGPPPPFEPPEFFEADDEFPFEPPDWWDESPPPDLEGGVLPFEEPVPAFDKPAFGSRPGAGGNQIRLRLGPRRLVVSGGSFQELLAVVKQIPGRRFNAEEKVWEIPEEVAVESVAQVVKGAGFRLEEG